MKEIKLCSTFLAILVVLHMVSQRTPAQFTDSMGTGWNNAMSASASTMIWSSIFYRTTGASKSNSRPSSRTAATSTSQSTKSVRASNLSAVKFRSTGTYIKTRELADSLGNTPTEREQYQKLMNAVLDPRLRGA